MLMLGMLADVAAKEASLGVAAATSLIATVWARLPHDAAGYLFGSQARNDAGPGANSGTAPA